MHTYYYAPGLPFLTSITPIYTTSISADLNIIQKEIAYDTGHTAARARASSLAHRSHKSYIQYDSVVAILSSHRCASTPTIVVSSQLSVCHERLFNTARRSLLCPRSKQGSIAECASNPVQLEIQITHAPSDGPSA